MSLEVGIDAISVLTEGIVLYDKTNSNQNSMISYLLGTYGGLYFRLQCTLKDRLGISNLAVLKPYTREYDNHIMDMT